MDETELRLKVFEAAACLGVTLCQPDRTEELAVRIERFVRTGSFDVPGPTDASPKTW